MRWGRCPAPSPVPSGASHRPQGQGWGKQDTPYPALRPPARSGSHRERPKKQDPQKGTFISLCAPRAGAGQLGFTFFFPLRRGLSASRVTCLPEYMHESWGASVASGGPGPSSWGFLRTLHKNLLQHCSPSGVSGVSLPRLRGRREDTGLSGSPRLSVLSGCTSRYGIAWSHRSSVSSIVRNHRAALQGDCAFHIPASGP